MGHLFSPPGTLITKIQPLCNIVFSAIFAYFARKTLTEKQAFRL